MLLLADSDDLSARESCLGLSGLVKEQFKFDSTEEECEVSLVSISCPLWGAKMCSQSP